MAGRVKYIWQMKEFYIYFSGYLFLGLAVQLDNFIVYILSIAGASVCAYIVLDKVRMYNNLEGDDKVGKEEE